MKKLLFALAVGAFTTAITVTPSAEVKAQASTKLVVKTITAADTTTFINPFPSKVRAFQATWTETSGTSAGKIYLEGTVNGTWVILDSLAITDVTTAQTKVTTVAPTAGTSYLSYRYRTTNTSSATAVLRLAWLRRDDD